MSVIHPSATGECGCPVGRSLPFFGNRTRTSRPRMKLFYEGLAPSLALLLIGCVKLFCEVENLLTFFSDELFCHSDSSEQRDVLFYRFVVILCLSALTAPVIIQQGTERAHRGRPIWIITTLHVTARWTPRPNCSACHCVCSHVWNAVWLHNERNIYLSPGSEVLH